jgi:hypothetical protein
MPTLVLVVPAAVVSWRRVTAVVLAIMSIMSLLVLFQFTM